MPASRRFYEAMAEKFKTAVERDNDWERFIVVRLVVDFADVAKADNSAFDRDKFYRASGVGHLAAN